MILYDKNLKEYSEFINENDDFILGTAKKQTELAMVINSAFANIYHNEVKDLPGRPVCAHRHE